MNGKLWKCVGIISGGFDIMEFIVDDCEIRNIAENTDCYYHEGYGLVIISMERIPRKID
jgi:hypothetical protein